MAFTITLQPSGHAFPCAADATVLSAGLAAGFFLPYNCRSGVCNTCRGRVVEGSVDFGAVHPTYLTEDDKAHGFALLCQARPTSDLFVEVRELAEHEVLRPKATLARLLRSERLAPDVARLVLGLPPNEPVIFRAGQYLDLDCGNGVRRSYSMANAPTAEGVRQLELHVRHLPGGVFTDRVFGSLKVREMLKIELPLGTFYLREDSDKPMVMLASGTGFAPIKSIVEHSLNKGLRRPIVLYWGGRRRADLYMADKAAAWAAEHAHISFVPVLSDATPDCAWAGRTGFVHRAVMQDFPDLSAHQVYACGAPVVVDSARHEFTEVCGLPADEFHADSFITAADRAAATSA